MDRWRGVSETRADPKPESREALLSAPESNPPSSDSKRTGHWLGQAQRLLGDPKGDRLIDRPLLATPSKSYPHFVAEAEGFALTDIEGRRYIDWSNAEGSVLLGHRHPKVTEALLAEVQRGGSTLTLMHTLEVEVAALLVDLVPCAERVGFGKHGSDVLTAALRLARSATGRDIILHHGHHGFQDWYQCRNDAVTGIPSVLRTLIQPVPFNDLAALEASFDRFEGQVAAVLIDPMQLEAPEPGYLEAVAEQTRRRGALLIFDEMVTGLRLANGGAQEAFGVSPDLCCLARGLANGLPLAAVVGREEIMRRLPSVGYGMTFRGETLSLAAAKAVLETLQREPVAPHLRRCGEKIRSCFLDVCDRLSLRCDLLGFPARLTFSFHDTATWSWQDIRALFLRECLRQGVLTDGNLLPSAAMNDDVIEATMHTFEIALTRVSEALREPPTRAASITEGFIESVSRQAHGLHVTGWLLFPEGPADRIELQSGTRTQTTATPVSRPDLANALPQVAGAGEGGFSVCVPLTQGGEGEDVECTLTAHRTGQAEFHCWIRIRHGSLPVVTPCSMRSGALEL